jgi:hypothetical protein
VVLSTGEVLGFDYLVLAMGSRYRMPFDVRLSPVLSGLLSFVLIAAAAPCSCQLRGLPTGFRPIRGSGRCSSCVHRGRWAGGRRGLWFSLGLCRVCLSGLRLTARVQVAGEIAVQFPDKQVTPLRTSHTERGLMIFLDVGHACVSLRAAGAMLPRRARELSPSAAAP